MRAIRSARFLLAPAVGLVLLAACTPGDAAPEPTETVTPTPTPTPTEDDDDATAAGSGGAGCLIGEWEADLDVIGQNATSAPGLDAFGAEVAVSGASTTTFDATTITSVYDDQQVEVSWSIEGQQFRMVTAYDGTLRGAYAATDGEITISEVDLSALTLTNTTFVNGEQLELPGIADMVAEGFDMGGTSTYTCTSDELRLQPVVEGVDTSNMVSVLHRR
jgi:hypothetical protein